MLDIWQMSGDDAAVRFRPHRSKGEETMTKTKAMWLSALCVFGSFGGLVLIAVLTVRFGWWVLAVALGIPPLLSAWYALYGDFRRMP